MIYKVKINHNIALDTLVAIAPQPRCQGLKATRTASASGAVYNQAPYLEFEFDILKSAGQYQALLDSFGLSSTSLFYPVTIYARNERFVATRFNGIAVRPQIGADISWNIFPRNVKILVKDLVELT